MYVAVLMALCFFWCRAFHACALVQLALYLGFQRFDTWAIRANWIFEIKCSSIIVRKARQFRKKPTSSTLVSRYGARIKITRSAADINLISASSSRSPCYIYTREIGEIIANLFSAQSHNSKPYLLHTYIHTRAPRQFSRTVNFSRSCPCVIWYPRAFASG